MTHDTKQLSSLYLRFCDKITDAAVIALAQGCPQLSSLNLAGLNKITDAAVIALAQGCPQLSSLNLYYCNQITDADCRRQVPSGVDPAESGDDRVGSQSLQ